MARTPDRRKNFGKVFYANSDLSGFSIFEEAQYRGVRAADRVLKLMGGIRTAPKSPTRPQTPE